MHSQFLTTVEKWRQCAIEPGPLNWTALFFCMEVNSNWIELNDEQIQEYLMSKGSNLVQFVKSINTFADDCTHIRGKWTIRHVPAQRFCFGANVAFIAILITHTDTHTHNLIIMVALLITLYFWPPFFQILFFYSFSHTHWHFLSAENSFGTFEPWNDSYTQIANTVGIESIA